MIFLSMATLTKIYPIIFLPYLIILIWKRHPPANAIKALIIFLLTTFSLLGLYLLIFKLPLTNFLFSIEFHAMKPVSTESLWAVVLTIYSQITAGKYPQIMFSYGISGLDSRYWVLPLWFYNYFWILPLGLLYLWLFKKINYKSSFDIRICLAIILLFLTFSKVLASQYLLWFTLLIPLLKLKIFYMRNWQINLLLVLLTAVFHQYIYPVYFGLFLVGFYDNSLHYLFWINATANLILIILFIRIISEIKSEKYLR